MKDDCHVIVNSQHQNSADSLGEVTKTVKNDVMYCEHNLVLVILNFQF